jgi:hypothetical protein
MLPAYTLHGSIRETLFHAPSAMLYHWNMIEPHDEQIHKELMLMPLVFTSYDNYLGSLKSFQEGLNLMEVSKICQKPTKYGQVMFCEAVKVDMANSKDSSFNHTITSSLSLITVSFEDLFEAITIHKNFCGEKLNSHPSISLLNKTNTLNEYDFTIQLFADEFNLLQKDLLMLFEAYCIFGYKEFYKKMLCILMEVNKTMYGNNKCVPDKLLENFLLSSPGIRNHMNQQVVALDHNVLPQSYRAIINKQEFIIHNSVT